MKLSKHFHDHELLSPVLISTIKERNALPIWYVTKQQLLTLEHIRTYFDRPVIINTNQYNHRGICTDQECIEQGRQLTSQHCRNGAYDITVKDIDPKLVGDLVRTIFSTYRIGGLGVDIKRNFCHIDWRNSDTLVEWSY
jgi:uncharacterized protein YcbK (DUF882 family)